MGGGGVAAFGDLAGTLAAVDCGRAAERGEPGRAAGDAGRLLDFDLAAVAEYGVSRRHSCPRFSCSGFAAPCRNRRSGTRRRTSAMQTTPKFVELFQGRCGGSRSRRYRLCTSLTAHWAFMFWFLQHLRNLPDVASWSDAEKSHWRARVGTGDVASIAGISGGRNCQRSGIGRRLRMCFAYFCAHVFCVRHAARHKRCGAGCGDWRLPGVFALFTMYLPPLFPTLLRTTGAVSGTTSVGWRPRSAPCISARSARRATTGWHFLLEVPVLSGGGLRFCCRSCRR